jgi:hypothetical protein
MQGHEPVRGKAMRGHSEKEAIHKPRREALGKISNAHTLLLGLLASRFVKKIHFCCLKHLVCDILLGTPYQTKSTVIRTALHVHPTE